MNRQPVQAVKLNPAFAGWEWVFSGATRDKNLGSAGAVLGFDSPGGSPVIGQAGLGYDIGLGGAGGLSLVNPSPAFTAMSGLIVFDQKTIATPQYLYTSNSGAGNSFFVSLNSANKAEIDFQGSALLLTSTPTVKPTNNVLAWSLLPNQRLAMALNGFLDVLGSTGVASWSGGQLNGFGYANFFAATDQTQYLSAVTVSQTLSDAQLIALSLNPWLIFSARKKLFGVL